MNSFTDILQDFGLNFMHSFLKFSELLFSIKPLSNCLQFKCKSIYFVMACVMRFRMRVETAERPYELSHPTHL